MLTGYVAFCSLRVGRRWDQSLIDFNARWIHADVNKPIEGDGFGFNPSLKP
jgi:hypothetical protein